MRELIEVKGAQESGDLFVEEADEQHLRITVVDIDAADCLVSREPCQALIKVLQAWVDSVS